MTRDWGTARPAQVRTRHDARRAGVVSDTSTRATMRAPLCVGPGQARISTTQVRWVVAAWVLGWRAEPWLGHRRLRSGASTHVALNDAEVLVTGILSIANWSS